MFPHERSLVKEMQGRPFVLLGVNTDGKRSTAKKSVKTNKLNWRSFFNGGTGGPISRMFKVRSYPTVMVIDHNGVIVHPNLRGPKLYDEIERLVKVAEGDGMVGEKIEAKYRTFRDKTGKHRILAIAEGMKGDQVVLRKKEGGNLEIALSELSRKDQAYLRTVDLPVIETEEQDDAFRTFTNATGKFSVDAKFVGLKDGKVSLEKRDGTVIEVELSVLSTADRDFVIQKDGFSP